MKRGFTRRWGAQAKIHSQEKTAICNVAVFRYCAAALQIFWISSTQRGLSGWALMPEVAAIILQSLYSQERRPVQQANNPETKQLYRTTIQTKFTCWGSWESTWLCHFDGETSNTKPLGQIPIMKQDNLPRVNGHTKFKSQTFLEDIYRACCQVGRTPEPSKNSPIVSFFPECSKAYTRIPFCGSMDFLGGSVIFGLAWIAWCDHLQLLQTSAICV